MYFAVRKYNNKYYYYNSKGAEAYGEFLRRICSKPISNDEGIQELFWSSTLTIKDFASKYGEVYGR